MGETNDFIISTSHLTKYYGSVKGIENVSLQVRKGTIHGFLGPNGAGKTTTIRILVGLLKASSGAASINGNPVGTVESCRDMGYLPSDFQLYAHYTVGEYLDFLGSIWQSTPLRQELVERFQLDENRKCKDLSRGNRQKVGIVQAFMHEPKLIIADEPTTGLDPLMQDEFNDLIKEYVHKGNTVFLSSHILSEVQAVCDYVSVIRNGEIVSTGKVSELLSSVPRKAILRAKTMDAPLIESIRNLPNVLKVEPDTTEAVLYFEGSSVPLLAKLSELKIEDVVLPPANLEDYFLPLYQGKEA